MRGQLRQGVAGLPRAIHSLVRRGVSAAAVVRSQHASQNVHAQRTILVHRRVTAIAWTGSSHLPSTNV
jgi:hypothetical protein